MEATIDARQVEWGQRRSWAITELVLVCLIAVGVLTAAGSLSGRDAFQHGIAVAIAEALVIGLIWWSQRRRGQTLADLGLTFGLPDLGTVGRTVGWSVVVFIATATAFIAFASMMSLVAGEPQAADVSMYDDLRGNLWAMLGFVAAVWITSSFGEEVIYRGFLIHRLEEVFAGARRATPIAVVVGGLIFGAIHYAWGLAGMMQVAVMGIALGIAYVTLGRRLWIVILAHAYLDTTLFVQIYSMGATGG